MRGTVLNCAGAKRKCDEAHAIVMQKQPRQPAKQGSLYRRGRRAVGSEWLEVEPLRGASRAGPWLARQGRSLAGSSGKQRRQHLGS